MALPLRWPDSKPFQPPTSPTRIHEADPNKWPVPKVSTSSQPADAQPIMQGISSDGEFDAFLTTNKGKHMSLVQFGSLHCVKCHEFFPDFLSLAKRYDRIKYGAAQVEWLKEKAVGIKFSPTFSLYSKQGRLVDQVLGKDKQKLEDHLWLWHDD